MARLGKQERTAIRLAHSAIEQITETGEANLNALVADIESAITNLKASNASATDVMVSVQRATLAYSEYMSDANERYDNAQRNAHDARIDRNMRTNKHVKPSKTNRIENKNIARKYARKLDADKSRYSQAANERYQQAVAHSENVPVHEYSEYETVKANRTKVQIKDAQRIDAARSQRQLNDARRLEQQRANDKSRPIDKNSDAYKRLRDKRRNERLARNELARKAKLAD